MRRFLQGVLFASFIFLPFSTRAATFSDFELTAVVQVISYNEADDYYVSGSGTFTDFVSGCVFTAAHVILDDNDELRDSNFIVLKAGTSEEEIYWATPLFVYPDIDVAAVCIDDETFVQSFRHYFVTTEEVFENLEVGNSLSGLGYPAVGGETVTATFGNLTGFTPYIGDKDYLKTDMEVAEGISGGPVVTETKDFVGILVAYTQEEGALVTYAASQDLLDLAESDYFSQVYNFMVEDGLIPEDCVIEEQDDDEAVVTDGIQTYYDWSCANPTNARLEEVVSAQYDHWCGAIPEDEYVESAVGIMIDKDYELGMDEWRSYLDALCGELETMDAYNFYTPSQDLSVMRLIKSDQFSTVYAVMSDGKRHVFPNESIYKSWFGEDYSTLEMVSSDELSSYALGKNITYHPGTLVKIPSIPKVYMVSDENELQWVADETTAQSVFGDDWNQKIYDVPESLFTNYTSGSDIRL